jgi:acyl carrier protein
MSDKIEAELLYIFNEVGLTNAERGQVAEDIDFADLAADSLAVMDLCVALEERYDLIIEPADVMRQATLRKLARFIAGKQRERA